MDFLLGLILAADVGSSRDVIASTGNVCASIGGISRGRVVLTGIVIAVVVRSSVGEEIRHASGCGSIDIVSRSSAVVGNRRRLGIRGANGSSDSLEDFVGWCSTSSWHGTTYT